MSPFTAGYLDPNFLLNVASFHGCCCAPLIPFASWQPHDAQLRGIMHGVRQHKRALCDVITTPGTDVGSDNRICTNTGTLDAHEMLAEYAHLLFGFTILCRGLNTLWIHPDSDLCHTLVHPERIQIRIYILSSTTSRKQQVSIHYIVWWKQPFHLEPVHQHLSWPQLLLW